MFDFMAASDNALLREIYICLIDGNRYKYYLTGIQATLKVSFFAVLLGILIGFIITFMKLCKPKRGEAKAAYVLKWILNLIADVYLDIIRGTPSYIQLLIFYLVIFGNLRDAQVLIGIIAFGVNSGAYVAEVIRSGIQSVDKGQSEAGRSLGLNGPQTMFYIIIPQAIKNILPSLANEFIILIKETSIIGYIGVTDIAKASQIILGRTYLNTVPLLTSAIIYFTLIKLLTTVIRWFEKRLSVSGA